MNKGDRIPLISVIPGVPPQDVIYIGEQELNFEGNETMSLFNLTKDVVGHPAGSTVSRHTLEEDLGYIFPGKLKADPWRKRS